MDITTYALLKGLVGKGGGASGKVYRPMGSVPTFADLPSNAKMGDVYDTLDTGMNYVAIIGDDKVLTWDALGTTIDLEQYYTKEEVDNLIAETGLQAGTHINIIDGKINTYTVEANYDTDEKIVLDSGKPIDISVLKNTSLSASNMSLFSGDYAECRYQGTDSAVNIKEYHIDKGIYTNYYWRADEAGQGPGAFGGLSFTNTGCSYDVYVKQLYYDGWYEFKFATSVNNPTYSGIAKKNCTVKFNFSYNHNYITDCTPKIKNVKINNIIQPNKESYSLNANDTLQVEFYSQYSDFTIDEISTRQMIPSSNSSTEYLKTNIFTFDIIETVDKREFDTIVLDKIEYGVKDVEARTKIADMYTSAEIDEKLTAEVYEIVQENIKSGDLSMPITFNVGEDKLMQIGDTVRFEIKEPTTTHTEAGPAFNITYFNEQHSLISSESFTAGIEGNLYIKEITLPENTGFMMVQLTHGRFENLDIKVLKSKPVKEVVEDLANNPHGGSDISFDYDETTKTLIITTSGGDVVKLAAAEEVEF